MLTRGLQHNSSLVQAGTLGILQQALTALQQDFTAIEALTAAMMSVSSAAATAAGAAQAATPPQHSVNAEQLPSPANHLHDTHMQHQEQLLQYGAVPSIHQQQPQEFAVASLHAEQVLAQATALEAAGSQWHALLCSLQSSARQKLPEVSVLVSLITNMQRALAAAGDDDADGAVSTPGGLEQSEQQRYSKYQAEWLLCQGCSVLAVYARWLPQALADGNTDLGRLLLQGHGQVSRLMHDAGFVGSGLGLAGIVCYHSQGTYL